MNPAPSDFGEAPRRSSLLRELADGSAGPVVRGIVTLALAALLVGAVLVGGYLLAYLVPEWDRRRGYRSQSSYANYVYPSDELLAWLSVLASLAFLLAAAWLWSRNMKRRALWYAGVMTVVAAVVTGGLCVLAAATFRGDEELIVAGIIFFGIGGVLVMWMQVWRHFSRARPAANAEDGRLDVRCPQCGYRMVGLHEARCPECGAQYTLDDLLTRQSYEKIAQRPPTPLESPPRTPAHPPPITAAVQFNAPNR